MTLYTRNDQLFGPNLKRLSVGSTFCNPSVRLFSSFREFKPSNGNVIFFVYAFFLFFEYVFFCSMCVGLLDASFYDGLKSETFNVKTFRTITLFLILASLSTSSVMAFFPWGKRFEILQLINILVCICGLFPEIQSKEFMNPPNIYDADLISLYMYAIVGFHTFHMFLGTGLIFITPDSGLKILNKKNDGVYIYAFWHVIELLWIIVSSFFFLK
uniref:Cytochrome c oxidase subunit III-like protein n=1 Tax=Babesia conradae TaxID=323731 RepID=W8GP17_9APIC|nr:cytochrome c oxidase subunit III-like protein [Babesia conradae]